MLQEKRFQRAAVVLLLLALTYLTYLPSFNGLFQLDDYSSIVNNRDVHRFKLFKTAFWFQIHERPFALLTFFFNYRFGQLSPWGYHVVNFCIHLINSALVFRLTQLILKQLKPQLKVFWWSLFSAAIFALHPLQTAAVSYIVQRMTELSALFYLLATLQFLRWRMSENTSIKSTIVRWFLIALWLGLGLLSKQNIASLPLTFIVLELFVFTPKNNKKKLIFLTVGTAFVLLLGMAILLSGQLPIDAEYTPLEYGMTQTRVIWNYFLLLIYPAKQVAFSAFEVSHHWGLQEIVALFMHLVFLIGAFMYRHRWPLAALGVFWMYAALSVESGVLPIVDVYFEHRMYLPLVGFCWVLLEVLSHSKWPQKVSMGVASGLVILFSLFTFQRNKVWENHYNFWTDIIEKEPENARAYVGLASYYQAQNNASQNKLLLEKSFSLKPNYEAAYNLGSYYLKKNQLKLAESWLQKAIDLNPEYAPAYNNLGTIATKRNQNEKAFDLYQKAVLLNADYLEAKYNLGVTAMRLNRLEIAEGMFYNYLDLAPNHVPSLFNSARVSILLNKYDQAENQLRVLLTIDPQNKAGKELQQYINQNRP